MWKSLEVHSDPLSLKYGNRPLFRDLFSKPNCDQNGLKCPKFYFWTPKTTFQTWSWKKNFSSKLDFFGRNWIFSDKIGTKSVQNRSKLQLLKTKNTSSSSKFCADFKTARLWPWILLLRVENGLFLSQGGVKNQLFEVKLGFSRRKLPQNRS